MLDKRRVIEQIRDYLSDELKLPVAPERASEIEKLLVMYRFLPSRDYEPEEVIVPSSLVELQGERTNLYCLVVPQGGGLVTRVDGSPVQVVTPQSPLGEALLGRRLGDTVHVELSGGKRQFKIVATR